MARAAWRGLAGAALCIAALQAHAHDSWLSPSRHDAPAGQLVLELGTGTRFPVQEFSQSPGSVVQAGCIDATGQARALRPLAAQAQWLDLAADLPSGPALACWAELGEAEIEIEPPKVAVYLDEIRTSAANRAAWAALQQRQLPWRERYRKFARMELPAATAAARKPLGLPLEIVVLGDRAVAVGQPLQFQVLRDGKPLADFPVELVSERSAIGVWRRSDAEGVITHSLPFAGRWLLRGTDLRLSQQRPDSWESRFVTLVVEPR